MVTIPRFDLTKFSVF